MKDLQALIRIISQQRIKKIDLFNEKEKLPYKMRMLYEEIRKGKELTDEDAMSALQYNQNEARNYLKLKSRLKERLLNTMFFIDFNQANFTSYRRALHETAKNYVLIRLLIDRTERNAAIRIAEKTFRTASRFEMTEFSLLICRELMKHYAFLQPDQKKYISYKKKVEHLKIIFDAEMISENIYCKVSNLQAKKREAFDESKLEMIWDHCKELRGLQKKIKSYKFNLDTYQICIYFYLKTRNYDSVIELSNEALLFFESKPFDDKISKYLIKNDIISSSIQIGRFKLAENYIQENLAILTPGSFNWFKLLNFQFINYSKQLKYVEMAELISLTFQSTHIKSYEIHHQAWLIKEAYINFIITMEKIEQNDLDKLALRPFRLNRFLNDVPIFAKDKRGLNVSILIIQMLFLIEQKKFNKVIDRMDALKQYTYRYLRNDTSLRSNCFIKMLLKIPDAEFHPVRTERYVEKLWNKLKSTPMEISDQAIEIEVVPYETLWSLVLELLQRIKD